MAVDTLEKTIEEVQDKTNDKLDKAFNNFKILKNSEDTKFSTIDNWLEKESNMFLKELAKKESKNFYNFKRGTIVKVDFGINLGSELCYTHFAIVLSNHDNIKQESIIVLPLTSKPGVGRLPLNNLIKNELIKNIKRKMLNKELSQKDIDEITILLNDYKKYKDFSYAFVSQITSISKSRIIFSSNKFDIINKIRCSATILDEIDEAITKSITGIDLESIKNN